MSTEQPTPCCVVPAAMAAAPPRMVESTALFQGQAMLLVRHLGEVYQLQTTRQGKLILTK